MFVPDKDARGVSNIETNITSAATADLCFQNVLEHKKANSADYVNAATWNPVLKHCYAETKATSLVDYQNWHACIFSGI